MKATIASVHFPHTSLPIKKHVRLAISVCWLNVRKDQLEEKILCRLLEVHLEREFPRDLPKLHLSFTPVNGKSDDVIINVYGPLIRLLQRIICYGDGDYFQNLKLNLQFEFIKTEAFPQDAKEYDMENVALKPWPVVAASENLGPNEFSEDIMENMTYASTNSFIGRRTLVGEHDWGFKLKLHIDMTDYANLEDLKIPCEIKNRKILENILFDDFELVSATGKSYFCHKDFLCEQSAGMRNFFSAKTLEENNEGTLSRIFKRLFKRRNGGRRYWSLMLPQTSDEALVALLKFVYYNSLADAQQSKSVAKELLTFAENFEMQGLKVAMENILSRNGEEELWMSLINHKCFMFNPPISREIGWSYSYCEFDFRWDKNEPAMDHTIWKYRQLEQEIKKLIFSARPIHLNIRPAKHPEEGDHTVEFEVIGEVLWALNHMRHQQYDSNFVKISLEAYAESQGPDQKRKVFTIEDMKLNPEKRWGPLENCCYVGYNYTLASELTRKWKGRVEIWVDMSWYNPTITPPSNDTNRSLLKEKKYTDFKLISIDGKEFPCHKDIISASCNKQLVSADLLAALNDNFEFHKCKYSSTAVESALKFIYYNDPLTAPPTPNLMAELLELSRDYGFETYWTVTCRIIEAQRVEWFNAHNGFKLFNIVSKFENRNGVQSLKNKLMIVLNHYLSELESDKFFQSVYRSKAAQDMFRAELVRNCS